MKKLALFIFAALVIFLFSLISCSDCEEKLQKINFEITENLTHFAKINQEYLGAIYKDRRLGIERELKSHGLDEGYGKIHEDLDTIGARHEWNYEMYFDASLALVDCQDGLSSNSVTVQNSCKDRLKDARELRTLGLDNITRVSTALDSINQSIATNQTTIDSLNVELISLDSTAYQSLPDIDSITYEFVHVYFKLLEVEQYLRGCLSVTDPDVPNPLFTPKEAF